MKLFPRLIISDGTLRVPLSKAGAKRDKSEKSHLAPYDNYFISVLPICQIFFA